MHVSVFTFFSVAQPQKFERKSLGKQRAVPSDWLVGCFELNDPLRQYFSLYRAVSQSGVE